MSFEPLVPGSVCAYQLKHVATEHLADEITAAYTIAVAYDARAIEPKDAASAFEIQVKEIKVKGRRGDYQIKLDSTDRGHLKRVDGGADTLLLLEAVEYFAMLDRPVRLYLAKNGGFIRLEGGQAIRERILALHPPKPRTDPHHIAKIKLRLSDEGIARRLWPSSVQLPKAEALEPKTQEAQPFDRDFAEYRASGLTAQQVRFHGPKVFVELRQGLLPSESPSSIPKRNGLPEIKLAKGERKQTVELLPSNPCFTKAGESLNLIHDWKGPVDEVIVVKLQKITQTRIWTKQAEAASP